VKVTSVDPVLLDIPFDAEHERNMAREVNASHIVQVCRVAADNGLVGYGEALVHGTGSGPVTDAAVARVMGRNPFDLMWDDSLGAVLQIALFDLAGKAAGVPVYRLLGDKVRDWCPISWWSVDMPKEDFAAQAQAADAQGYTINRIKARPWFDIREQVAAICAVVPASFRLSIDLDGYLLDSSTALCLLKDLERFSNVAYLKQPLPYDDFAGHRRLRARIRPAIVMHYGSLSPVSTALREEVCDGFIIRGGASEMVQNAAVAAMANKPFGLQIQGMATGIGTAFLLHFGAVLSHCRWPAMTGMHIYAHQLLMEPLAVHGGYCRVPDAPGLGVTVDEAALERFATVSPVRENLRAIYVVIRPSGELTYYGQARQYVEDFRRGNHRVFEPGVRFRVLTDDGGEGWAEFYGRLQAGPLRSSAELL